MRKQVSAPTGTQLHRAWRARPYRFRELACEPWLLACQPPEQRLALEAHDAPEAGRRHRGVVLRPTQDRPRVHPQHVRDLPSRQEHRQHRGARARAPLRRSCSIRRLVISIHDDSRGGDVHDALVRLSPALEAAFATS